MTEQGKVHYSSRASELRQERVKERECAIALKMSEKTEKGEMYVYVCLGKQCVSADKEYKEILNGNVFVMCMLKKENVCVLKMTNGRKSVGIIHPLLRILAETARNKETKRFKPSLSLN